MEKERKERPDEKKEEKQAASSQQDESGWREISPETKAPTSQSLSAPKPAQDSPPAGQPKEIASSASVKSQPPRNDTVEPTLQTPAARPDYARLMDSMFGPTTGKCPSPEAPKTCGVKNSLFDKTDHRDIRIKLRERIADIYCRLTLNKKQSLINTGVDIGVSAVKCATFSCVNNVYKLINLDIEEIAHENFESAGRPDVIKEGLKKLRSRHALQGKMFVSVVLPNLLVEFMYLPVMPSEELDKAIRWQAKEKLLVDEENYILDYLVLGEEKIAQQANKKILFFSVPKKDILDNYRILSSLGLQPQAIRPNFLSAFHAFADKGLWRDDETVGFLDIGAGASQFSIICGGYLNFSRRFSMSADSITRSIADYCRISYEEAERAKRMFGMSKMSLEEDRKDGGVSGQPLVRISHAIGLHLDQLITEIQHTFNYFSIEVSNNAVAKMDRLILTGGGACVNGICDFFKGRMNMPVEAVSPFNYTESDLKDGNQKQLLSNEGARFAAAVGLGLKV